MGEDKAATRATRCITLLRLRGLALVLQPTGFQCSAVNLKGRSPCTPMGLPWSPSVTPPSPLRHLNDSNGTCLCAPFASAVSALGPRSKPLVRRTRHDDTATRDSVCERPLLARWPSMTTSRQRSVSGRDGGKARGMPNAPSAGVYQYLRPKQRMDCRAVGRCLCD